MSPAPTCLGCGAPLTRTLVDLGLQPLANAFVPPELAALQDTVYPLHARVCDRCLLVQVDRAVSRESIFNETYAYFSSYSQHWLAHCKSYVEMAVCRFNLTSGSKVVEIASNDGYLLQYMVAAGIPVLGIEPSSNVAHTARAKGIPTEIAFFGRETAQRLASEGHAADLIVCKNVLAHVPDINDFVAGLCEMLKPEGVCTIEFPHLLNLIQNVQFDTIYHEHFTYLSVIATDHIFARNGLRVFDVEEVPTHGGSLRISVCHMSAHHAPSPNVATVRNKEIAAKLDSPSGYAGFARRVEKIRGDFTLFLNTAKRQGKRVAGYGAAAKGNTLLNYCGVNSDQIAFVSDLSLAKQGKLLPGSRIPVTPPAAIAEFKPDYVLVLPWNLRTEIMDQFSFIRGWGGRFVTAVPEISVT
jgi:2-polyprenyl-3-methyl-5-hydroxy-6-metoxy-1,4-benzoquinol methylase